MSHRRRSLVALLLGLAALPALADTIETVDGKTITGRILEQTPAALTVEVRTDGMSFRRKIPTARVKQITREAAEGPGYYPLPISGEIGADVTAEALGRALDEVRRAKPQFVILVIDSAGGSGPEMLAITERLRRTSADMAPNTRFIAYVKRAYSAGAVIALACPEIYFAPDATMGAGVPARLGPGGKPVRLDERTATEIRAQMRAAATGGGHSDLILRGMMEPELELGIVQGEDHRPQVVEQGGNALFGATPFKSAGQVLTLTAREAVQCGLAGGTADDVEGLCKPLGLSAWHKSDDAGWYVMTDAARHNRLMREQERQPQPRGAALGGLAQQQDSPAIAKLKAQLKTVEARGNAAQQKLESLKAAFQKEQDAAQEEYKQAIASANSTNSPAMAAASAVHKRNARLKKANETYPPQIAAAQSAVNEALAEYNGIVTQGNKLMASGAGDQ
jgi:ATP-dependent protease ClpP protease subunit